MSEQSHKEDYVARFGDQSNVSRLVFKGSERTNVGVEYYVINGVIAAKFVDGVQEGPTRPHPATTIPNAT